MTWIKDGASPLLNKMGVFISGRVILTTLKKGFVAGLKCPKISMFQNGNKRLTQASNSVTKKPRIRNDCDLLRRGHLSTVSLCSHQRKGGLLGEPSTRTDILKMVVYCIICEESAPIGK